MTNRLVIALAMSVLISFANFGISPSATRVAGAQSDFEFTSYKDIQELIENIGYTKEAWQAGIREIPRIYINNVPERWRSKSSKEVSVAVKKELFFRLMAPLLLRANELILQDRARLEMLLSQKEAGEIPKDEDDLWLKQLAIQYRVLESPEDLLDANQISELLARVDIIPLSLGLSQAAEESGWGTSRFADLGNSLFGQWTWGEGITPAQQRSGKGDYKIAAYDTPLESFMSYALNLNTHSAYGELRDKRAELRAAGEPIRGVLLAETLTKYSERGQAYVDTLKTIMRVNKLDPTDAAYLKDEPPTLLVPVGEGAQ